MGLILYLKWNQSVSENTEQDWAPGGTDSGINKNQE